MHGATIGAVLASVIISAVLADGHVRGDGDESVQLWNVGSRDVDLRGWRLEDGEGAAVFGSVMVVAPGERLWIARSAGDFAASFGHAAGGAWGDVADAVEDGATPIARLRTAGGGPRLSDAGDGLRLRDDAGVVVDAVVWGAGDPAIARGAWRGPPVQAYGTRSISRRGQVLHRKLDPDAGSPLPDTDHASDWASDRADVLLGRRTRRPGWDLEAHLAPLRARQRATLEVAVAPDGLRAFLLRHIGRAERWIDLLTYTFDDAGLSEALAARARAGVRVRVLVDGSPAGGHEPDQRWALARLAEAGAEVLFMDRPDERGRRYRSAHAKLMVVDGLWALVGTENLGRASAPPGGGAGRRGAWLATDAPAVVRWAAELAARDLDARHADLRPWSARDPDRGAPGPGYRPPRGALPGRRVARWPDVARQRSALAFEMLAAPESALHPTAGLLGLLASAGPGDTLRVAQLREPPWWGGGAAEGRVARNPRLAAYVVAARRGARVRVLMDAYFDDPMHPNANAAAARWLNATARRERLALEARLANPTGHGLHAKIVLLERGGGDGPEVAGDERGIADGGRRADVVAHRGATEAGCRAAGDGNGLANACAASWYGGPTPWVHVGSLNGSEVSSKANREVAMQVASAVAHARLAEVFDADWAASPAMRAWLPAVGGGGW